MHRRNAFVTGRSIADEFLALLKQQAQNWQPGHPLDSATTMGTLIDSAHADSVHTFIREGEGKGQLLLDGRNAGLAAAIGRPSSWMWTRMRP